MTATVRGALLLDLDGTLIDSRADIAHAVNQALRGIGLAERPLAEVAACVGDGADKLIERLTPGSDTPTRARALGLFKDYYAEHCWVETVVYPGVRAALTRLRAEGWRLAVVTNKPLSHTVRILERSGLAPLMASVRGGDRTRKPDPGQLLECLEELGCRTGDSWMIGDHHTDIRAGRSAGCRVCFCAWGIGERDGLAVDAVVEQADELAGVLAGNRPAG